MTLPRTEVGTGEPTLTFVHGFTQTRSSWHIVIAQLAKHFRCVALDAPHHGEARSVNVDFDAASDLVADSSSGSVLIGYSMGGRLALGAAVRRTAPLRGLVLVSTTAGIVDETERAERAHADEALARRIESIGTAAFLEEWTSQPMFRGTIIDEEDRRGRLTNSPASLAQSLRTCGAAAQSSLWDRLSDLQLPTLIIVGERDAKFVGLGHRLRDSIGGSELIVLDDAGHAAHLDQPSRFTEVVADFVSRRVSA